MAYPAVKATVNGKPYLAIAVNWVTYIIWTAARDIGCNLTQVDYGNVQIDGSKPPQVTDGQNTYIEWSSIPGINPNPTKNSSGTWQFTTTDYTPGSGSQPAYPILDLNANNIKSFVLVRSNIGGWFFDAELQTTHTSTLTITSHPVQTGNSVTDYAFLQPRKLSMNIGMSDVAKSLIPGQFETGTSRSIEAFKILQKLQSMRIPIQVYSRLGLYQNMLVETLTTQDDHTTTHGLKCTVDFQELLVAKVSTVKVSSNPAVTNNVQKGNQQPQQLNASMLWLAEQLFNGKSIS